MRWAEFVRSCLCTGAIGSIVIWLFVVISMGRQGIQASKGPCHCTGEMARANRVSGAVRGSQHTPAVSHRALSPRPPKEVRWPKKGCFWL